MVTDPNRPAQTVDDPRFDPDDIGFEDVVEETGADDLLAHLLRLPGTLREGFLYSISLTQFREHLGAEWLRLRERIHETVDHALKDMLGAKDVFLRTGDGTYLVSFGSGNAAHAAVKTAKIAHAIREKLFGDKPIEARITLVTQDVLDRAQAARPGQKLTRAAEQRHIMSARVVESARSRELQYIFTPVWDAVHKVLSTYVCTPMGQARSGAERFGGELVPIDASDIERAEFYARTLEIALDVAEDLYRNQFAVFIAVQCDYRALSSPKSREVYFAMCRRIPDHLKKLMRVQLIGADETIPVSTLTERIGNLKPYFPLITLRLHSLDEAIGRFAFMGLHALSYPVKAASSFDYDRASNAIKQARNARIRFAFSRVPDLAMADRLVSIGATYLSGRFLGAALDAPENMVRCTLDDLGRMGRPS